MSFVIFVNKDKVRDPLTRELMWTAYDNTRRYVSGGFTRDDALRRVKRRIFNDYQGVDVHILVGH